MTLLRRPYARPSARTRRRLIAALCGVALMTPTACTTGSGSDGDSPASSTATSAAASVAADPAAAERKAVLKAYSSYWEQQLAAYEAGAVSGTELTEYAVGDAVARVETDLESLKSQKVRSHGGPHHDVRVTRIDVRARVPKATLSDCLDVSSWTFTSRTTGKAVPTPTQQITRYRTLVQAEKWGKQWKILSALPQKKACTTP